MNTVPIEISENIKSGDQLAEQIKDVCSHYTVKGDFLGYASLKSGNINKTYAVFTTDPETNKTRTYLLQQVNATVFSTPEIISENMELITSYIYDRLPGDCDRKRLVERVYHTNDGHSLYIDNKGHYWRLKAFIFNATCVNLATETALEKTGVAFGRFLANLYDFPIDKLQETIKDFHNTPKRIENLRAAYNEDKYGRRCEVDEECRFVFSLDYYASFFENAYKEGKLPRRVTHNDTKCNNVMFDSKTMEPLAVVDLDTVMPGFTAYDFGDAIRFGANTRAEDDPEFSLVELDLGKYEAFCRGYLGEVKDKLTRFELETLPIGVITTILELCARFLEDYLRGDVYFACRRDRHNYDRSMNQIALLRSALSKLDDMNRIIKKYID